MKATFSLLLLILFSTAQAQVSPPSGVWPPTIDPKYGGNALWNGAWRSAHHDSTNDNAGEAAIVNFAKTTSFAYKFSAYTPGVLTSYIVPIGGNACADVQGVYIPALYPSRPYQHCLWISPTGTLVKDARAAIGSASGMASSIGGCSLTTWLGAKFFVYLEEGRARINLTGIGGPSIGPDDDIWGNSSSNGSDVFYANNWRVHGPVPGFACVHANGTTWGMNLTWDTSCYGIEWAGDTDVVFVYQPPNNTIPSGLYCKTVATGKTLWFLKDIATHSMVVCGGNLYSQDGKAVVARSGADGTILWQYPTTYPVLGAAGNVILTMTAYNRLVALRRDTGALLWMQTVPRVDGLAIAKGSGTIVLTSSISTGLYSLALYDLATGGKVASGPTVATGNPQPILIGNRVLFADRSTVKAIDSPAACTSAVLIIK